MGTERGVYVISVDALGSPVRDFIANSEAAFYNIGSTGMYCHL